MNKQNINRCTDTENKVMAVEGKKVWGWENLNLKRDKGLFN